MTLLCLYAWVGGTFLPASLFRVPSLSFSCTPSASPPYTLIWNSPHPPISSHCLPSAYGPYNQPSELPSLLPLHLLPTSLSWSSSVLACWGPCLGLPWPLSLREVEHQNRRPFWDSGFTCGSDLDLCPAPRKAHVLRRDIKWWIHPPNPSPSTTTAPWEPEALDTSPCSCSQT